MDERDKRSIVVSSLLADYQDWPGLAQVFKLERQSTNALGQTQTQIRYGVTSLPASVADAKRLLDLTRGHWRAREWAALSTRCHHE